MYSRLIAAFTGAGMIFASTTVGVCRVTISREKIIMDASIEVAVAERREEDMLYDVGEDECL